MARTTRRGLDDITEAQALRHPADSAPNLEECASAAATTGTVVEFDAGLGVRGKGARMEARSRREP